ncbi:MAG: sigma-E factor negative regulatory protein [Pseudomonadota bacterium]|nr:sigma-E factor negative regulatory protein [Pseudomonadota bacterium]
MISPKDHQDRESLSALFDGELQGDAARFAHKRLAQDLRWRESCGHWQLAGDVLRGRATAPAPNDFPERVQREFAREVREVANVAASPAPRRGWMGGAALAASVAVAAWFVGNPFEDAAPTAAPQTPAVAAAAPPAAPPAVFAPAEPPFAPAAVASAENPADPTPSEGDRRVRQTDSAARARVALDPRATEETAALAGASADRTEVIDATALADPFRLPPAGASTPRPWPRAVLPASAGRALTAGYGRAPQNMDVSVGASDQPGFYPFEPRLGTEGGPATFPDPGDP